jgi:hypothetical protein
MLRLSLALALATLLSGCMMVTTAEDRAAAVIAADDAQCQAYGAQPLTPAYVRCRDAIFNQRQATAARLAGVALADFPAPIGPEDPHVVMAPAYVHPEAPVIQSRY